MSNKKVAIYPGTFDPFTIGHKNILDKAESIFGKENVIVSVGYNPEKTNQTYMPSNAQTFDIFLAPIDRFETIKKQMSSKNIEKYEGFLTDYIFEKEKSGFDVTVIRGLRNGSDLNYEVNQMRALEDLHPNIKIVFIHCDKQFEHVSSSLYRSLEKIKQGSGHKYLAREI